MLGNAIESCPEALWNDPEYTNPCWHVAYHTLFYTHLYLQTSEADFRPWEKHRPNSQYLGPKSWTTPEGEPADRTPYTKAALLEYWEFCRRESESRTAVVDLEAESGFSWLRFNKLETQFYNIRHIQHHTGQLADRLRRGANMGLVWVRPE